MHNNIMRKNIITRHQVWFLKGVASKPNLLLYGGTLEDALKQYQFNNPNVVQFGIQLPINGEQIYRIFIKRNISVSYRANLCAEVEKTWYLYFS